MKITQTQLIKQKNSPEKIKEKTKKIYRQILKESQVLIEGNFKQICTVDLMRLFELYDQYFFKGFFYDNYRDKLKFHLSKGTAEKYKKDIDKIAFPETYFFRGPVSWTIRTYSKFLNLPATYSSQGSHYTQAGGNMSDGII